VLVKGSSSVTRLEVHVSFKTKYCNKVFDYGNFKERCREILYEAAEKQDLVIKEMGFDREHVHMTWLMKVYHDVAYLSKCLKGTSGRKLLKEFPTIKRRYFWGSGLWTGVIYADTIGKDPETMYNYVRNQGKQPDDQTKLGRFFGAN